MYFEAAIYIHCFAHIYTMYTTCILVYDKYYRSLYYISYYIEQFVCEVIIMYMGGTLNLNRLTVGIKY